MITADLQSPWVMQSVLAHDAEFLNHAVSGSNLEVSQFRRGAFQSQLSQFLAGPVRFDHGKIASSVRARGELAANDYTLSFFKKEQGCRWNGRPVPVDTLMLFEPGGELDGVSADNFEWVTMVLPASWIDSAREWSPAVRLPHLLDTMHALRPDARSMTELQTATHAILDHCTAMAAGGEAPDAARPFLLQRLKDIIGHVVTEADDSMRGWGIMSSYIQTARRAEHWLREHLCEAVGVEDLCAAVRVNRRSLEYAFRQAYGTSPKEHLRMLRLHEVRKRLRHAMPGSTTVSEEALKFGFLHMSVFAQHYKNHFGESPSVTLARTGRSR